jgi:CHAT domain-containing protein
MLPAEGRSMNAPPYQYCPDDEMLQELAAGIGSPVLAQQTMQHVSRCNACGAALRRYINEFSDEQSPENAAILKQLQSSRPQWQKREVRKLMRGGRRFSWIKVVPAAAALAVAIVAVVQGPALLSEFRLRQAQKQAAAAFTERRTTEMRLPAVQYAPYRPFPIVLGAENGRGLDDVPTSLHEASGAANKNLRASNADPRWLQIQGRALLWEATPGSLEKAEKDFEKARASGFDSPSLEIDLAASYFERDTKAEHPNLQRSLNLLSEVLSKPNLRFDDRASALYDLSIAYEKTQAWDMAVSTWEKYLQVDASGAWADEARQRLKDAKARLKSGVFATPLEPSAFIQEAANGDVRNQVEEYQEIAIASWLPDGMQMENPESLRAVHILGDLLIKQNSDPWLVDLVSSLRQKDASAVRALAIALQKNRKGDHLGAVEEARKAAAIFARSRNFSGEFRARLEEVNALRRALNGAGCLARADPLWKELTRTRYHWLQARLSLEKAECGNLVGEFAESDIDLQTSRQLAGQFNYPLLVLRDIGISAGNKHLRGNCDESWKESAEGLNVYWQKTHASRDRLYQFYSVMFQCALETGFLHSGEALLRHVIEIRETTPDINKNKNIEGILHLQLANVLQARRANREAEQERQKAASLIDHKGLSPQFELTFQLEPAELELGRGDARLALATLEPLRKALAGNPDSFFSLRFNQALGNTYHKLGQLHEAEVAYQAAIKTAETALGGIKERSESLQWLRATDESYRGLVRVLIEQKREREALDRWEVYRSRPMLQDTSAAKISAPIFRQANGQQTNRQLASSLDIPTTRLVYAVFSDGLHIWLSRDGELTSQWVGIGKQDFEGMVREFAEKCAAENSNLPELHQLGAKLFSVLLQPVISKIPSGQTIIVELDRMAYSLPMEALRAPNGAYFGEKYAIVYSPGVWVEKSLRSPERVTGQEFLLLLDASGSAGGYLPGLEIQRNSIAQLFPRTKVIHSDKISWSEVRPRLASSQILHYMGHGRPDGSGTSLDYDSQPLRARDFGPELLQRSKIVVLAACSGAAGRDNGIADTKNLVRAFLFGGVPSIIGSHWNVDSASTSQLMISFYKYLAQNETASQAMYNARIDVLRTSPHPYFWAGFTLTGRAI